MSHQQDYRTRIYENYASNFQDAPKTFDNAGAWHWGRAYRHYLRTWLPEDKNAKIVDLPVAAASCCTFSSAWDI